MLTTFDDFDFVQGAIAAGASGFLLKDAEPDDLLSAVRTVYSGESVLAPRVTSQLLQRMGAGEGAWWWAARHGFGRGYGRGRGRRSACRRPRGRAGGGRDGVCPGHGTTG